MVDTRTIQTGSVVTLKADPSGTRTIYMTVVGKTNVLPAQVQDEEDKWLLCRWQWEGRFHTDIFNEKELILITK